MKMAKLEKLIFKDIEKSAKLYEGCGNLLLIVRLPGNFNRNDRELRQLLTRLGLKHKVDSILVLTGNPTDYFAQGYHLTMDVFEPRGKDNSNMGGSWSTMCGNGIRAVARYMLDEGLISVSIKTGSGNRNVSILPENKFRVCMGEFSDSQKDLKKYVSNFNINKLVSESTNLAVTESFIGLNGDRINGQIDGEPHLCIILPDNNLDIREQSRLCNEIGSKLTTDKRYFPEDINTSLVTYTKTERGIIFVQACTYERGVEYVTKACGTAATVIGSHLLSQNPNFKKVNVSMLGGIISVDRELNKYFMTGPANRINL